MKCPNCDRIIPNKTHLVKNGCKWCIKPKKENNLTPSEFIYKVYYWLSYQRGFPGWKTKFVKQIEKLIKLVKYE